MDKLQGHIKQNKRDKKKNSKWIYLYVVSKVEKT